MPDHMDEPRTAGAQVIPVQSWTGVHSPFLVQQVALNQELLCCFFFGGGGAGLQHGGGVVQQQKPKYMPLQVIFECKLIGSGMIHCAVRPAASTGFDRLLHH